MANAPHLCAISGEFWQELQNYGREDGVFGEFRTLWWPRRWSRRMVEDERSVRVAGSGTDPAEDMRGVSRKG